MRAFAPLLPGSQGAVLELAEAIGEDHFVLAGVEGLGHADRPLVEADGGGGVALAFVILGEGANRGIFLTGVGLGTGEGQALIKEIEGAGFAAIGPVGEDQSVEGAELVAFVANPFGEGQGVAIGRCGITEEGEFVVGVAEVVEGVAFALGVCGLAAEGEGLFVEFGGLGGVVRGHGDQT